MKHPPDGHQDPRPARDSSNVERLKALAELRLGAHEGHDLPWLLDRVAWTVNDLLPADGGASVILWDVEKGVFTLSASTVPRQTSQTAVERVRTEGGATRWIVEHGVPLVVEDTADDPFTANRMLREASLRSYVGVPLFFEDESLGVLYALSKNPRTYTEEDIVFLELVAASAAHAITFARQRERLDGALIETLSLLRVSRALLGSNDLDEVYKVVVSACVEIFAAERVRLLVFDHEEHRIDHLVTGGRTGADLSRPDYLHVMAGLSGEVVRSGRALRSAATEGGASELPDTGGVLVAPIEFGKEVVGTLTVTRRHEEPDFTDHALDLLEGIASQASLAHERAVLYDEARRLATTDELTGVHNRREMLRLGAMAYARASRSERPLAAVMLDVDNFKTINDDYGHPAGDEVLRELSRRCLGAIRQVDIFARYGGEEFTLLLPETDLDAARTVAGRLLSVVAERPFEVAGQQLQVTISCGLALDARPSTERVSSERGVEALLQRSDEALYLAKRAGRNRVVEAP